MKQIEKDTLCKYCLGCNKEEDETFKGTRNCKGFIAGYINWRELYEKALNEKKQKR